MCYQGEANSIRLSNKCLANSRMISINCRYFEENSHTICLDVDVHDSFNILGTGSIRCLHRCQCTNVPHQTFASFSHAAFAFCSRSGVNLALRGQLCNRKMRKMRGCFLSGFVFWLQYFMRAFERCSKLEFPSPF